MLILVIDDDGLAGAITAALLEDIEHDALVVESVAEAQACLEDDPDIALIICDLHMPDTNGLAFLRRLREEASTLPFILLTGTPCESVSDGGKSTVPEDAYVPDSCLLKDETLEAMLGDAIAKIFAQGIKNPQ